MQILNIELKSFISFLVFLLFACSGCSGLNSGSAVKVGDSVDINYLCRLNNGEVAAATDSVSEDQPKSNLYVARKEADPVLVIVSAPDGPTPEEQQAKQFEELIAYKLTRLVAGMKEGEKRKVELQAKDSRGSNEGKNTAHLARVRIRPKLKDIPINDIKYRTGKTPEVGDSYAYDPAVPGRVEAVTEKYAVVRFSAKPGEVISTPFGPGLLSEDEKNYYITIDAHKNALVRVGSMIGKITDVNDKEITIFFGNPFADETLFCDLTVEKIKEKTAEEKIKAETTENTEGKNVVTKD